MAKININPGACGMKTSVAVRKKEGKTYSLSIISDCPMVTKLGEELPELHMMEPFKRFQDSGVYKKGSLCIKHTACPVPSGILKALEVEAGLNVPKPVTMTFEPDTEPDK